MNKNLTALLLALFFPLTFCFSQYTEMINTNRPGVSQGAFSVGKKVLQFETGFSLGKEKHDLLNTETNGFSWDYSVRYGVWKEELEISLIGEYQSDNVTDNSTANPFEYKQSNFKSNTLGAKYLVYDPYKKRVLDGPNLYSWRKNNKVQWEDLIPAVAVYAGANFDFADNPYTPEPESSISPKVAISTQNNFIGGFVFVTNLIADRIGTDAPSYSYILTLTHAVTRYFSVFVENQGIKSDFYADQILRGGAACLINQDFHVDASVFVNFKDTPSKLYGRIGVAYRFDMHSKDEYIEDKMGKNKEKKEKKAKKRKDNVEGEVEDDGGLLLK